MTKLKIGVVTVSDRASAGIYEDLSGKAIVDTLQDYLASDWEPVIDVVPDERIHIENTLKRMADHEQCCLIVTTGGTGPAVRDITPESITPLLDREIPGIMEAARNYGQNRTPYSMLSRGVAGVINNTVILALPGSTNGAKETMDALFPSLLHIYSILRGARHE